MQDLTPENRDRLTESEAHRRLVAEGLNELPAAGTRSLRRIALGILREPMFALLLLEALRAMTSPRAVVIRDGARRSIPGREVVRGDLVVVGEGDRVPADARCWM